MSASKRTRYEVLRRDNHACRYCGATAPDAILTVDHVTPVSLGGSDDPANLVAACKDCNAGKSSSSPDATLVADVDQDAVRWAATLRAALQETAVDIKALNKVRKAFLASWGPGHKSDLPTDYIGTIEQWVKIGVPIEVMTYAAEVASGKSGLRYGDRFRYACGIVWRKVDDAREKAAPEGSRKTEAQRCGHCWGCKTNTLGLEEGEGPYTCRLDDEPSDYDPCEVCGSRACLYQDGLNEGRPDGYYKGREAGRDQTWEQAHALYQAEFLASRCLELVTDGKTMKSGMVNIGPPGALEAVRDLDAAIAAQGLTELIDSAARARDPWASQEAPF